MSIENTHNFILLLQRSSMRIKRAQLPFSRSGGMAYQGWRRKNLPSFQTYLSRLLQKVDINTYTCLTKIDHD